MTPTQLANRVVAALPLTADSKVLEPSFGDGAFIVALVRKFMDFYVGSPNVRLAQVLKNNVYGAEIDQELRSKALSRLEYEFGELPATHELLLGDFFRIPYMQGSFDYVVGNPPYGGVFDPEYEDQLDKRYGYWSGLKLKKETYSFFIARSLDLLTQGGSLHFITSDTFLTIKTMGGLRRKLMDIAKVDIESLPSFSDEVSQTTLVLHAQIDNKSKQIRVNDRILSYQAIERTGNLSWGLTSDMHRYFNGRTLGDVIVATSGMTVGKNEYFVREVVDGVIWEPFDFAFYEEPVTVAKELAKARLGKLSERKQSELRKLETAGETVRNVRVMPKQSPIAVQMPHPHYRYYNKATPGVVYSPPKWAIFWRDEGDAVLTFKKNGNWYLRGTGGKPYFGREGLTWNLVASRINMRYLPEGYILDSGAPSAFLRTDVDKDELWFILAWTLSGTATKILKSVLNHTRNIQSKDIERLPYPSWVSPEKKQRAILLCQHIADTAMGHGQTLTHSDARVRQFDSIFEFTEK